jgi:hypothetical protein
MRRFHIDAPTEPPRFYRARDSDRDVRRLLGSRNDGADDFVEQYRRGHWMGTGNERR